MIEQTKINRKINYYWVGIDPLKRQPILIVRKKQIRDIVYEYVYFTPVEELVIEDAIFQRLRFVYQNSSAYLTYPSNQLTRFSHSLGVMHIGSQMLLSALKNSSNQNFWSFIKSLENKTIDYLSTTRLFNGSLEEFKKKWLSTFGNISDFSLENKIEVGGNLINENASVLVNYLWQSIRIACLIHDIGHFPFSHVFEMGLESYRTRNESGAYVIENLKKVICDGLNIETSVIKKPTELHEFFGAYILKDYSDNLTPDVSNSEFLKICLLFAIDIFKFDESIAENIIKDEGLFIACIK